VRKLQIRSNETYLGNKGYGVVHHPYDLLGHFQIASCNMSTKHPLMNFHLFNNFHETKFSNNKVLARNCTPMIAVCCNSAKIDKNLNEGIMRIIVAIRREGLLG